MGFFGRGRMLSPVGRNSSLPSRCLLLVMHIIIHICVATYGLITLYRALEYVLYCCTGV